MSKVFSYTGRDNLDAMSFAKKYNNHIYTWLSQGLVEDGSVLDFGAGHREFFNRFQNDKVSAEAIEPDLSMHQYYPNKVIHQSIEEVEKKFNLIYSVNVLEHIYDDEAVVKLFKNYLIDKNSTIKIFVPARQELFSAMDKKVGHYRRYSKYQLEKLFVDNGYVIKSCHYFDSLGYFAAFIYKFVNKDGNISKRGIVLYDTYALPLSIIADKIFCRFFGKNIILEASLK